MIPSTRHGRRLLALKLTDEKAFLKEVAAVLQQFGPDKAADVLGVGQRTIYRWRRLHPELRREE